MASPRLLQIIFRYPGGLGEPDPDKLRALIEKHCEEWLRWNFYVWFVWTAESADEWFRILRAALPGVHFMINRIDQVERHGWADKWVWEWLDQQKTKKA